MWNNKGFTLLEILIAIFIFTIVAMIMSKALHTVMHSQTQTELSSQRFSALETAINFLSRDLEQVIDRPILSPNNSLEGSLVGTDTHLSFTHGGIKNPTGTLNKSTLGRTRYYLEKQKIFRENWPALDVTTQTKPSLRELLIAVESLKFEYLDAQGQFHHRWPPGDSTKDLPRAVKATIKLKGMDQLSQLYMIPVSKNAKPPAP